MDEKRVVALLGEVNESSANLVITKLLELNSEDETKPIYFLINSNGGSVDSGLAIYDTIQYIKAPVYTTCCGLAASMGAFLLTCGVKRSAFPHSKILIHQPLMSLKNGVSFSQSELKKLSDHLIERRELLEKIMADNCGVSYEQIKADCERDHWMDVEEAKAYGIIHEIITKL